MMMWAKRITLGFVTILLLVFGLLAIIITYDTNFGVNASGTSNTTYNGADYALQGYLTIPTGEGPFPAILLLHEWWGLTDEIAYLADALAKQGYVVLAPDVYRNRVATTVPGALWMRITTATESIWSDADSALTYLHGLSRVNPGRVASVGFCFGGEQSLRLAIRQSDALTAVVVFYGATTTDQTQLAALESAQPVLGIFGADDQQIPVAEVEAFEKALAIAGIEHTITLYEGVGHAFVTAENYDKPGPPGEAWLQLLTFLDRNVRSGP